MSYLEDRMNRKNGLLPKMEFKKPKKPIAKIGVKKQAEINNAKLAINESDLDAWFDSIRIYHCGAVGGCVCMECKRWIPETYMRCATAHLLPKKIFKSVATHPLNYLILGAGCGCHDKTHTISKFVKMKIWPEAKKRILEMMPMLPMDELRRISNQLLIALDMADK